LRGFNNPSRNLPSRRIQLQRIVASDLPSLDWALLKGVSRSFYLTLRALPAPVRESIALAYLLARLSDTIADGANSDSERRLLARSQQVKGWLAASPDRGDIENVWRTIQNGQNFDRTRFSDPNAPPLSKEELDLYTYLVAGCVGEFWTALCAQRMPGFASRPPDKMTALGIRFGKGLQLVNILRDRAVDSASGRTYVPAERTGEVLLDARRHLQAARQYVDALKDFRLRVACALPVHLAEETLDLIERNPSGSRIKVPRSRVWCLLLRATIQAAPLLSPWTRPG